INFKHIQRPKDWDIKALRMLFKLLGLNPNEADLIKDGKETPVQNLQKTLEEWIEKTLNLTIEIEHGLTFWGIDLLTELQIESNSVIKQLNEIKVFLEKLRIFNTPGKLKNLQMTSEEIETHLKTIKLINKIEELKLFINETIRDTNWFTTVVSLVFSNQNYIPTSELKLWYDDVLEEKAAILSKVKIEFKKETFFWKKISSEMKSKMAQLKEAYIQIYLNLHKRTRLGISDEKQKENLLSSDDLIRLESLIGIDLIPEQQLRDFRNELADLKVCYKLSKKQLENYPICPHCSYNPATEKIAPGELSVADYENELESLTNDWTELLLTNLKDPSIRMNINLLQEKEKQMINSFIEAAELPEEHLEDFVATINTIFSGLQKISIKQSEWLKILEENSPTTPEKLKHLVNEYINTLVSGKDVAKVRITLS
ncbi:MAG TPA: DUF6079 family protein, partial [Thermotogota bacterium]|nr:DUF6079 family protein [Thermotogota bacterium]